MRLPWERKAIFTQPTGGQHQATRTGSSQGDPSRDLPCPAADVEDMIQRKLEMRSWPEGREDRLWPAVFCLGE